MLIRSILALCLVLCAPVLAQACVLTDEKTSARYDGLQQLPDGIFTGALTCGEGGHPLSVWTMPVDQTPEHIGVRDDPLFATGLIPLTEITRIGYSTDTAFTVFRRTKTADGSDRPRRLFATVCREGVLPLDCSIDGARVKMRIDLRDGDGDGAYDRAYHQISIFDGAARLQVIFIDFPNHGRPHRMVHQWIELFQATDAVALPG